MTNASDVETCGSCGSDLRPNAEYCRECGQTAPRFIRTSPPVASTVEVPLVASSAPDGSERPSAVPTRTTPRPRYVLAVFWAFWTIVCLVAGFNGVWWGILLAIVTGAYSVYLFRGGRWGFWFF